jgi:hypothetical protein
MNRKGKSVVLYKNKRSVSMSLHVLNVYFDNISSRQKIYKVNES